MPELRRSYDAVIIGAGFAGMYALRTFRDQLGLDTIAFEVGDEVGGTWYWNRYPGARCDVESLDYCYSFDADLYKGWEWSERYPTQPEIHRYQQYVADTLDLRRDIRFGTRVTAAEWDERSARWTVETGGGERVECKYLLAATGCLSVWQVPQFTGLDEFGGETYHTGAWPQDGVDFSGKRVAVIGTGSSGVQSIPHIAAHAEHLTVLQRTPNFSLPAGQTLLEPELQADRRTKLAEWRQAAMKTHAGGLHAAQDRSVLEDTREQAHSHFEQYWGTSGGHALVRSYNDLMVNEAANEVVADFVRDKIRAIVIDPHRAELLCPTDHPLGSKRLIIDTNYFETYNRSNVDLIDVRINPIVSFTPSSLVLEDGTTLDVDAVVFATGFDAMTGALSRMEIRGTDRQLLTDAWVEGPKSYLGLQVAGFPNLFTITGPGSPSVLCNMILAIEQHVDWIAECVTYIREHGVDAIEATLWAQENWVAHVNEVAQHTLYVKANSWYLGANIPGKPRVFMPYVGGMAAYKARCDEVAARGYEGFALRVLGAAPA